MINLGRTRRWANRPGAVERAMLALAKREHARIAAPSKPKCKDCDGRGWNVGECHPREVCDGCSGTGVAKKGTP